MSPDGLELYFGVLGKPGGHGSCDVWVSSRASRSEPWAPPENLGSVVNSQADELPYSISSDGLEFYFADCFSSSARRGGQGGRDIWITRRTTVSDPWSTPDNLGSKVNSPFYDYTPIISDDSLSLLFTANGRPGGHGDDDIWITTRSSLSGIWGEPVNLGPPVNGVRVDAVPILNATRSILYFCSDRPGGFGKEDIWHVPVIVIQSNSDPNQLTCSAGQFMQSDPRKEVMPE